MLFKLPNIVSVTYFCVMISCLSMMFYFQEALHVKGLRDDTTCIVIDIQPPEKVPAAPSAPPKKQGKGVFKSMFRKKPSESSSQVGKEYSEPDLLEELFEEGSAMLADRFGPPYKIIRLPKCLLTPGSENMLSLCDILKSSSSLHFTSPVLSSPPPLIKLHSFSVCGLYDRKGQEGL